MDEQSKEQLPTIREILEWLASSLEVRESALPPANGITLFWGQRGNQFAILGTGNLYRDTCISEFAAIIEGAKKCLANSHGNHNG